MSKAFCRMDSFSSGRRGVRRQTGQRGDFVYQHPVRPTQRRHDRDHIDHMQFEAANHVAGRVTCQGPPTARPELRPQTVRFRGATLLPPLPYLPVTFAL
jgi:hypothetical protein